MPYNMPGGKILAGQGSQLNILHPVTELITRLDVAWIEHEQDFRLFHKGHSGTLGAIASRITALDWTIDGVAWWDLGNPPESLLMSGWGCSLQFGLGSPAGQASYGQTPPKFWVFPSGVLRRFKIRASSEGNEDDVVTASFQIAGNSRAFLLPEMAAEYSVYIAQLTALGQIPWWLSTMGTLQ
jgi:hypothetical protein